MRFAILLFTAVVMVDTAAAQRAKPAKRPLEGLAGQHILVLPVQYVTFADSLGWVNQVPSIAGYMSTLDDEISYALGEHGLKGNWTFADAITQRAKRNADYVSDPHALEAEQLRIGVRTDDWQLHEPLASQLRSLLALVDARYVLFPVQMHFVNAHGKGQALLHVVVLDARRSQVQWAGDVHSVPADKFSPALAADVASRLADLIAPEH